MTLHEALRLHVPLRPSWWCRYEHEQRQRVDFPCRTVRDAVRRTAGAEAQARMALFLADYLADAPPGMLIRADLARLRFLGFGAWNGDSQPLRIVPPRRTDRAPQQRAAAAPPVRRGWWR